MPTQICALRPVKSASLWILCVGMGLSATNAVGQDDGGGDPPPDAPSTNNDPVNNTSSSTDPLAAVPDGLEMEEDWLIPVGMTAADMIDDDVYIPPPKPEELENMPEQTWLAWWLEEFIFYTL